MRITHTSKKDVLNALTAVNKRFDNNIEFGKFEPLSKRESSFCLRLKVKDSSKSGAKLSATQYRKDGSPRRTAFACWHVHGYFRDALNSDAVIYTSDPASASSAQKNNPGDPWIDYDCGDYFNPVLASDRCDC